MMSKSTIKFYLIPGIIFIIITIVIVVLSSIKQEPSPTTPYALPPTPSRFPSPTPYSLIPSPLPIQDFTGADVNQELPQDIKTIGQQKTALRRLTPLTLPLGLIEFDYENDLFLVRLSDPKEESKTQFNVWRQQNYPALAEDKFIFN